MAPFMVKNSPTHRVGGLRIYRISTLYHIIVLNLQPPKNSVVFSFIKKMKRRFRMKIHLTTLAIALTAIAPSSAAVKCVNIPIEAGNCTSLSGNGTDWSANCGGQEIRGVAVCSASAGKSGALLQTLTTTATSNNYCWCKMTYPVLSDWVVAYEGTISNCPVNCAAYCTQALSSEAFVNSLYIFNSSLL